MPSSSLNGKLFGLSFQQKADPSDVALPIGLMLEENIASYDLVRDYAVEGNFEINFYFS